MLPMDETAVEVNRNPVCSSADLGPHEGSMAVGSYGSMCCEGNRFVILISPVCDASQRSHHPGTSDPGRGVGVSPKFCWPDGRMQCLCELLSYDLVIILAGERVVFGLKTGR